MTERGYPEQIQYPALVSVLEMTDFRDSLPVAIAPSLALAQLTTAVLNGRFGFGF